MEINDPISAIMPSLLGMAIIFAMLTLIMLIIYLSSAIMKLFKSEASTAEEAHEKADAPLESAPVAKTASLPAPGSAGDVKLYDTPDRTAAMIMAIVADKMQKPLNQIRFISIKKRA